MQPSSGKRLFAVLLVAGGTALVLAPLLGSQLGLAGVVGPALRRLVAFVGGGAALVYGLTVLSPPVATAVSRAWQGPVWSAGGYLMLGAFFGLLAGTIETVRLALQRQSGGLACRAPAAFVWMVPLGYLVILGAVAVLLAGIRVVRKPAMPLHVVVFALTAVVASSQLLPYEFIDGLARWIVSLGIATVIARAALARPTGFGRLVLVGSVVLAVGLLVWNMVSWRRPAAADPSQAASATAPSVLLIVLDTVRADHLSVNGYERPTTPRMAALGEQGVVFERAIAPYPWTLPSHATMFTGYYSTKESATWRVPLDETHSTIAEVLGQAGFDTGGFIGNLYYLASGWGVARGFGHYMDYLPTAAVIARASSLGKFLINSLSMNRGAQHHANFQRNDARAVTDGFLSWLDARGDGAPYFAFLNYADAHAPYEPPGDYATRYGEATDDGTTLFAREEWTDEQLQGAINAYDGCIEHLDAHIGEIVDKLEQRGTLQDTLVIVTADHGEHFGEHGLLLHGNSLYRANMHVPLLLYYPRALPRGERVGEFVSLHDLPATISGLVGIDDHPFPGESLARHWAEEPRFAPVYTEVDAGINTPPHEPVSRGDMQAVYHEGFQYILNGDAAEELYDFAKDPHEANNLVDTSPMAAQLRAALEKIRAQLVR